MIKHLTRWEIFNHFNAIFKDRGPKVTIAQIFLDYSHPRKVTTICSRVIVIKCEFIFFMCQTPSQDRVNTTTIQSVTKDYISLCMMLNVMTFITR